MSAKGIVTKVWAIPPSGLDCPQDKGDMVVQQPYIAHQFNIYTTSKHSKEHHSMLRYLGPLQMMF